MASSLKQDRPGSTLPPRDTDDRVFSNRKTYHNDSGQNGAIFGASSGSHHPTLNANTQEDDDICFDNPDNNSNPDQENQCNGQQELDHDKETMEGYVHQDAKQYIAALSASLAFERFGRTAQDRGIEINCEPNNVETLRNISHEGIDPAFQSTWRGSLSTITSGDQCQYSNGITLRSSVNIDSSRRQHNSSSICSSTKYSGARSKSPKFFGDFRSEGLGTVTRLPPSQIRDGRPVSILSVLTLDLSCDDEFSGGNSLNNSLHIDVDDDDDDSKSDHQRNEVNALVAQTSRAYARKSSHGDEDDTFSLDTEDLTRQQSLDDGGYVISMNSFLDERKPPAKVKNSAEQYNVSRKTTDQNQCEDQREQNRQHTILCEKQRNPSIKCGARRQPNASDEDENCSGSIDITDIDFENSNLSSNHNTSNIRTNKNNNIKNSITNTTTNTDKSEHIQSSATAIAASARNGFVSSMRKLGSTLRHTRYGKTRDGHWTTATDRAHEKDRTPTHRSMASSKSSNGGNTSHSVSVNSSAWKNASRNAKNMSVSWKDESIPASCPSTVWNSRKSAMTIRQDGIAAIDADDDLDNGVLRSDTRKQAGGKHNEDNIDTKIAMHEKRKQQHQHQQPCNRCYSHHRISNYSERANNSFDDHIETTINLSLFKADEPMGLNKLLRGLSFSASTSSNTNSKNDSFTPVLLQLSKSAASGGIESSNSMDMTQVSDFVTHPVPDSDSTQIKMEIEMMENDGNDSNDSNINTFRFDVAGSQRRGLLRQAPSLRRSLSSGNISTSSIIASHHSQRATPQRFPAQRSSSLVALEDYQTRIRRKREAMGLAPDDNSSDFAAKSSIAADALLFGNGTKGINISHAFLLQRASLFGSDNLGGGNNTLQSQLNASSSLSSSSARGDRFQLLRRTRSQNTGFDYIGLNRLLSLSTQSPIPTNHINEQNSIRSSSFSVRPDDNTSSRQNNTAERRNTMSNFDRTVLQVGAFQENEPAPLLYRRTFQPGVREQRLAARRASRLSQVGNGDSFLSRRRSSTDCENDSVQNARQLSSNRRISRLSQYDTFQYNSSNSDSDSEHHVIEIPALSRRRSSNISRMESGGEDSTQSSRYSRHRPAHMTIYATSQNSAGSQVTAQTLNTNTTSSNANFRSMLMASVRHARSLNAKILEAILVDDDEIVVADLIANIESNQLNDDKMMNTLQESIVHLEEQIEKHSHHQREIRKAFKLRERILGSLVIVLVFIVIILVAVVVRKNAVISTLSDDEKNVTSIHYY